MRDQQGVGRRRPERERHQARAATARVARQSTDAASARCTRAGPWRSRAGSTRRLARGGSTRRWSPRRALCCAAPSRRRTAARTRRAASPPDHPKHQTPIAVATRSAARIATTRGSVCARWCQAGRSAGRRTGSRAGTADRSATRSPHRGFAARYHGCIRTMARQTAAKRDRTARRGRARSGVRPAAGRAETDRGIRRSAAC